MEYHMWDQELCDPETVKSGSILIPVGPWATGQASPSILLTGSSHDIPIDPNPAKARKLQVAGTLMQNSLLDVHVAWQTFLLRHGVDNEIVQEWSRNTDHGKWTDASVSVQLIISVELRSVVHKSWFRFSFCCARKREDKGLPAPKLPDIQGFSLLPSSLIGAPMLEDLSQDEDGVGSPYPVIEMYDTQEKSVEGIIRRRELHIDPTTSVVRKAWEMKQALEANN
jgi:hypothetical protein